MECGIDEAGRGPLIGPLVIAGVLVNEDQKERLKNIGVRDSKQIPKPQLERYAEQVKEIVQQYHVIIVSAKEIDDALNDPKNNLNWLEALKAVEIIDELQPKTAIIDAPSNNIEAFTNFIKEKLKHKPKILCEHKADEHHVSAGAASILAKAEREAQIHKMKQKINKDFGSGYPSDPKTKAFVEKYYQEFPDIFRKTWQTYKNMVEKKKQKGLKEF